MKTALKWAQPPERNKKDAMVEKNSGKKHDKKHNEKIRECEKTRGRYHNDYSPRYQEPYDIYEKAKRHMKKRRKEEKRQKEEKQK